MSKTILTPKGKVFLFIRNGKKHLSVPSTFSGSDLRKIKGLIINSL